MDRRVQALIVSILVVAFLGMVVGGCSIIGCFDSGNENPQPTPTPTPTITDTPVTTTPTPGERNTFRGHTLPAGVFVERINGSEFTETHRSSLSNYEFDYRIQFATEAGNTNSVSEEVLRDGDTVLVSQNLPATQSNVWMNSSIVVRSSGITENYYVVSERTEYSETPNRLNMASLLNSGDFVAQNTVNRDNQTFIQYTASNPSETADEELYGAGVSDYSATLIISPDGYMKAFTFQYNTQVNGEFRHVSINGVYNNIGNTTVEKPAWVDTGLNSAPRVKISRSDTYASFVHNGGASVPGGTTYFAQIGNQTTQQTIEDSYDETDVWYIYKQDGQLKISKNLPENREPLPDEDIILYGRYNGIEVLRSYNLTEE